MDGSGLCRAAYMRGEQLVKLADDVLVHVGLPSAKVSVPFRTAGPVVGCNSLLRRVSVRLAGCQALQPRCPSTVVLLDLIDWRSLLRCAWPFIWGNTFVRPNTRASFELGISVLDGLFHTYRRLIGPRTCVACRALQRGSVTTPGLLLGPELHCSGSQAGKPNLSAAQPRHTTGSGCSASLCMYGLQVTGAEVQQDAC